MAKKLKGGDGGTRERILEGAATLFCEQGFAHGSIRSIAALTGIQGASIYHYFRSKEEMTEALLREGARQAMQEFGRIDRGAVRSREALLDAAVAAHMRAYRHPGKALAALVSIYRQLPPDLFAFARGVLHPYLACWVELVQQLTGPSERTQNEAEAMSLILFGAMNALVDWQDRPGFALASEPLHRLFVGMMLHGMHPFDHLDADQRS